MEADTVALVAAIRRIQELATDTPEGTLAEAREQLGAIRDECDIVLAVSVREDDPAMCSCGSVTERECSEAVAALPGCTVAD